MFAHFLQTASFSQASVLNIADVAREAVIERRTVANYFDVLEDLLMSFRLPVFSRRAKRHVVSHPKFYFFDAGVYRSIHPTGPLDNPEEIEGAEVDIVAYGPRGIVAIEVKRSARISTSHFRGLRLFRKDYPMARCHLFIGGERREHRDGIELWPVGTALHSLPDILGAGSHMDLTPAVCPSYTQNR